MKTNPVIGVLAIQGDVREHISHLNQCDVTTVEVRTPAQLEGIDGLVIPGGESTTMSILAQRNGLLEPLRELKSRIPMYGSCAGLIMLADRIENGRPDQETIGGINMTAARNAFGRQVDSFEIDLSIPVLGSDTFHAVFIRAPLVVEIGPNVTVLATLPAAVSNSGQDQIVAVQQGNLLATSFHPEITSDLRFHQYFVEMVKNS